MTPLTLFQLYLLQIISFVAYSSNFTTSVKPYFRNGMLTPLCLADMINPLPQLNAEKKTVAADVYRTVYEHMEEI